MQPALWRPRPAPAGAGVSARSVHLRGAEALRAVLVARAQPLQGVVSAADQLQGFGCHASGGA